VLKALDDEVVQKMQAVIASAARQMLIRAARYRGGQIVSGSARSARLAPPRCRNGSKTKAEKHE